MKANVSSKYDCTGHVMVPLHGTIGTVVLYMGGDA